MSDKAAPIVFVTGTDTDVGKTFISSILTAKWGAEYWKPVQTGIEDDCGDTATVEKMCESLGHHVKSYQPAYELQKPLCPMEAMDFEPEIDIKLSDFSIPTNIGKSKPLIVEGAGGMCVPITRKLQTTGDLLKTMIKSTNRSFGIVVVARSGLGTLNHTLLTIEHLKAIGLGQYLLGCILSGKRNCGNAAILRRYGVTILAQIDHCVSNEDFKKALEQVPLLDSIVFSK